MARLSGARQEPSDDSAPPTTRAAHHPRHWPWVILSVAGLALAGGATCLAYVRDMQAMRDRLTAGSLVVQTQHGAVEYATWGEGPPALALHGAGGGWDQGVLLTHWFGGEGFRWIVPSRFGYLRSPLPPDPSTAAQADALAALLDVVGIERVEILAMSGGVPPALQFAARYPQRTAALVLLSAAPYTPFTAADQDLPVPSWVYQALFSSDFPFWVLTKVARPTIEPMFDVTPALRAQMTPEEAVVVAGMIDGLQPVTLRMPGQRNEEAAIDPGAHYALDAITAPTLVVHAQDDGINPFPVGERLAQQIRGARFVPIATGGHLLLGHQEDLRALVNAFLRQHRTASTSPVGADDREGSTAIRDFGFAPPPRGR